MRLFLIFLVSNSLLQASATRSDIDKLVLGCGEIHNELTCTGFPHAHSPDDSITIDTGRSFERFGVSQPTIQGSATDDELWNSHFQPNQFREIKIEAMPVTITPQPIDVGNLKRQSLGLSTKDARKIMEWSPFHKLQDLAAEYLMPGGSFVFCPAVMGTLGTAIIYEKIFMNLLAAVVDPKTATIRLRDAILKDFDLYFDTASGAKVFSHMEIAFYELEGEYPYTGYSERDRYRYDIDTLSLSTTYIHIPEDDGNVFQNYVILTFVKKLGKDMASD